MALWSPLASKHVQICNILELLMLSVSGRLPPSHAVAWKAGGLNRALLHSGRPALSAAKKCKWT
eukprot:8725392-Alexandrium_andersonii.AAC.1